jgi:hypothetical protein
MNTSVETGSQLSRRSRSEVSNAASSSTGATNSASARSGSSVHDGLPGRNASAMPPSARKVGYGTLVRRASADSSTAPSSRPMIHSKVIKQYFPLVLPRSYFNAQSSIHAGPCYEIFCAGKKAEIFDATLFYRHGIERGPGDYGFGSSRDVR